jgi:hypothetical protein
MSERIYQYGTHALPLVTSLMVTDGSVLELGIGSCSTLILDGLCRLANPKRTIYSLEESLSWIHLFKFLDSPDHVIKHVGNYEIGIDVVRECMKETRFGLALVDTGLAGPSADDWSIRSKLLRKIRDFCDVIVLHDSEMYKTASDVELVSSFKHVWEFKLQPPCTLVLSDQIDVGSILRKELQDGVVIQEPTSD